MSGPEHYLESSASRVVRLVTQVRKENPGKRAILRTKDVTIYLSPEWGISVASDSSYVAVALSGIPKRSEYVVLLQATKVIEVLVE